MIVAVTSFHLSAQNLTLAISDFVNNTQTYALENRVPELLKTELSILGGITVVQRSKIDAVLREQALGQTGVIGTDHAQRVGKLLGAEFVLTGEINRNAGRIRIDVHMTHAETGEVFAEKVTAPSVSSIDPMLGVLAHNIKHNLLGQGERIKVEKVRKYRAPWILAAGVVTGCASIFLHNSYSHHYDQYQAAERLTDFDRFYDQAQQKYQMRNLMIGTTAAVLTTGLVLYLNANSDKNKIYAHQTQRTGFSLRPYYHQPSKSAGILLTIRR